MNFLNRIKQTKDEVIAKARAKAQAAGFNRFFIPELRERFVKPTVEPVKRYFQPTPQVRVRDILRELGIQTKEVAREIPRSYVRAGMEINKALGLPTTETYTPETKIGRTILGERPITRVKPYGEETLRGFGVGEKKAVKFALPAGLALTAADIIPGFGGKGALAKNIAKESTEIGVKKLLGRTAQNYPENIIKTMVKEKDVAKIGELLKIKPLMKTTDLKFERIGRLFDNENRTIGGIIKVGDQEYRISPGEHHIGGMRSGRHYDLLQQDKGETKFLGRFSGVSQAKQKLLEEIRPKVRIKPSETPEPQFLKQRRKEAENMIQISKHFDEILKTKKVKPTIPIISKKLQPLAQEARKYKTAEEFVRADAKTQNFNQWFRKSWIPKQKPEVQKVWLDNKPDQFGTKSQVQMQIYENEYKPQLTNFYNQAIKGIEKPAAIKKLIKMPRERAIKEAENFLDELNQKYLPNEDIRFQEAKFGLGKIAKKYGIVNKELEDEVLWKPEIKKPISASEIVSPKVVQPISEDLRLTRPMVEKEKSIKLPQKLLPESPQEIQKKVSLPPIMPQTEDALQKLLKAVRQAKPIRAEQQALYRKARGQKLAKLLGVAKKTSGEKGFFAELGQLKGELPKAQFESLRGKLTQGDVDNLFDTIKNTQTIDVWDKISAREGLAKVLGVYGGQVPTRGEIKLLEKTLGTELANTLLRKRPFLQKLGEVGYQLANIPRSLMSSFDLSAPFRQGIFLVGKPKRFFGAFKDMFKSFGSEKAYKALMEDISKKPSYSLMKDSKLALTEIGTDLTVREEAFMSNWAEKIPGIGIVVKASGRAYTGFLNKLRADVFNDLVNKAKTFRIDVNYDDLAKFVNSATGRGSLGSLERSAVALNSVFFSPRLTASRLNLIWPGYYIKLDPFVRKEALKSLFIFTGTVLTVLGLAKAGGAEVGADPRSADFGKIKIGKTRIDVTGGFQQYIKLAAQLITGKLVSSTTGKEYTLGEGYKPITRLGILSRALEYKTSPIASFATDFLRGETSMGEKFNLKSETIKRFTPMVSQDIYDLYKEQPELLPLGGLGIFGFGVQTYGPTLSEKEKEYLKGLTGEKLKKQKQILEKAKIIKAEEDIKKQKQKDKAQALYDEIKNMPIKQQKEVINNLKNKGELDLDTFKKMKEIRENEQKSPLGQILSGKSVQARANIVWDEIKDLSYEEQKNRLNQYRKDGILTYDVFKKLKELRGK